LKNDSLLTESDTLRLKGRFDEALNSLAHLKGRFEDPVLYSQRGLILCEKGDYDDALLILKEITEHEEEPQALSISYHGLGRYFELKQLFHHSGDYDKAQDFFNKSLQLKKSLNDPRGIAELLFRVGVIYERKNNPEDVDKSIPYYNESIKMAEESGEEIVLSSTLTHLAGHYEEKGEIEKSFEIHQQNLSISEKLGLESNIAWDYLHVGRNLSRLNLDIENVIRYYRKSIEQAQNINYVRNIPIVQYFWARIYLETRKFDLAKNKFQEAINEAQKTDNKAILYPSLLGLILTLTYLDDYSSSIIKMKEFVKHLQENPQYDEKGVFWCNDLGTLFLSLALVLVKKEEFSSNIDIMQILNQFNLKPQAKSCFDAALAFSKEHQDYYSLVPTLYELGTFLYNTGDLKNGITYIEQALTEAQFYRLLHEETYIKNLLRGLKKNH
jgi:tetratricopeptide (TPR) repeat protein